MVGGTFVYGDSTPESSGRKCYITPAFLGVPKKGVKIRIGCLTHAFSLPSQGPTSGQKCYITRAFSGIPNKGDKFKSGNISLP